MFLGIHCFFHFSSHNFVIHKIPHLNKKDLYYDECHNKSLAISLMQISLYRCNSIVLFHRQTILIDTLKEMNFANLQEQGFVPLYKRLKITDDLHETCGFRTDYQFITKGQMKTIQKKSKRKE